MTTTTAPTDVAPTTTAPAQVSAPAKTLPAIGEACGGGFFIGITEENGQRFANVCSGAEGELIGRWNESLVQVAGALSRTDGLSNTAAMAAAGSGLAKAALTKTINGFSDWAIPAPDQQELQYRELKPTGYRNYADGIDGVNPSSLPVGEAYTKSFPAQTTIANFREGGVDALAADWYWSSAQPAVYPTYAWNQGFGYGGQDSHHKSAAGRARLVRRFPI